MSTSGATRSGGALSGTAASRPAAAVGNTGQLYWATDTNEVSFSDGATWHVLSSTSATTFQLGTNGALATAGSSTQLAITGSTVRITSGELDVASIPRGLRVAEGTNAKQGVATLVAGTVTVANTSVTANSRILAFPTETGTLTGILRVSARTVGTNFTVTSTVGTDTAQFAWLILEPG